FQSQPASPSAYANFSDLAALVRSVPTSRRNSHDLQKLWQDISNISLSENTPVHTNNPSPKLPHGLLDDDFIPGMNLGSSGALYLGKQVHQLHHPPTHQALPSMMSSNGNGLSADNAASLFGPAAVASDVDASVPGGAGLPSLSHPHASTHHQTQQQQQQPQQQSQQQQSHPYQYHHLTSISQRNSFLASPVDDFSPDIRGLPAQTGGGSGSSGVGLVRNASTPALSANQASIIYSNLDEFTGGLHSRHNISSLALDEFMANNGGRGSGIVDPASLLNMTGSRLSSGSMLAFGAQGYTPVGAGISATGVAAVNHSRAAG
ncbi:hypothetical protein EV182_002725, partial [Spiromyces aspiralis]